MFCAEGNVMGVGLYLNGHYDPIGERSSVEDWLTEIENWWEDDISGDEMWGNFFTRCRTIHTHDGHPALSVSIHPAAEEVEFIVVEPGHIRFSAKTSTVGPGYHTALCQLMKRFADDLKVSWNPAGDGDDASYDESGYFFTGDRDAIEKEMLLHLKTIARISIETLEAKGFTLDNWHMSTGHSYAACPGDLRTPTGIRSREWIQSILDDPRNGIDIYPWWEDGLTPRFRLGRALCDMWTKVRWRPILTDDEYEDGDWLHLDLCHALAGDPTLDFPWREWAELIDMLDESEGATMLDGRDVREEVHKRAKKRPLIGYRRYPVKVELLDGWSITIPGEMVEQWDKLTWSAWDGDRTVWVNNWGITKDGVPIPAQEVLDAMKIREGEIIPHQNGDLIGKAILGETEENDETLINLQAFSAVDGKSALCNIYYHDEEDYDWAIETWHSLSAPPDRG